MDSGGAWTLWAQGRPQDPDIPYRWRVSARSILGMQLHPEWTENLRLCGMGYAESEYWPGFSDWNGYRRTVDPTLEWRPARPGEVDATWEGLGLLPCPWTGKPPKVIYYGYIGAPPYRADWIGVKFKFGESLGWRSAKGMVDAWNTRAQPALNKDGAS